MPDNGFSMDEFYLIQDMQIMHIRTLKLNLFELFTHLVICQCEFAFICVVVRDVGVQYDLCKKIIIMPPMCLINKYCLLFRRNVFNLIYVLKEYEFIINKK